MKLENYLKHHNMTKKKFGKLLGCTGQHIGMICNGKAKPSRLMAMEICRVTHGYVTIGELIPLDEEEE